MGISKTKKILLNSRIEDIEIYYNYQLEKLSSFKVNGIVPILIIINSDEALIKILNLLETEKLKYFIIGGGTNTLINHNCKEIIIKLGKNYNFLKFYENKIIAGASILLGRFIIETYKNNFDFSFLAGIPGTIGGAVFGNCGNKSEGICNFIESIEFISIDGNVIKKEKKFLKPSDFGYRFLNINNLKVITNVIFKKEKSKKGLILNNIRKNIRYKKETQPLNTFNCGCFFKNSLESTKPTGQLIDELNLKGFKYGGASVSRKHANFIENINNATPKDIFNLAKIIKGFVKENYNINLEYEVKLVGF